MKILKMGENPTLPDAFHCPICGAGLVVNIDEWTECGDEWMASECGVHTGCATEPDLFDSAYGDHIDRHYQTPYVDWMPVDFEIYMWLEKNYRFVGAEAE